MIVNRQGVKHARTRQGVIVGLGAMRTYGNNIRIVLFLFFLPLITLARPGVLGALAVNSPRLPFHQADKKRLGGWLVTRLLVVRSIKRAFAGVFIHVDPAVLRLRGVPPVPVIFCSTHSSWWDGYMTFVCNSRIFHHDGYLMMEEANLARYGFFTWLGVFGVDRDDPRKALASIEYITDIMRNRRGTSLWMFPQGTITHPDRRPLKLYGGVANIARKLRRCAVVPVAMRYEFMLGQAPDAFIRIGAPLMLDLEAAHLSSRDLNSLIEGALTATMDALHNDVVAGNLQSYRHVLDGRGSVNRVWDAVVGLVGRLKSVLARG